LKKLLVHPPKALQRLFPKVTWALPNNENKVYLTFDDGPIPEVTPWVLDQLKAWNAKATFFCIGDNVRKQPALFSRIISEGHSIGNHTYHHLKGWDTKNHTYLEDVNKAEATFKEVIQANDNLKPSVTTKLFRPPYGKITSAQVSLLRKNGYQVIMWDVLSMDYSTKVSEAQCLENVKNYIKPGSIIVFHDSLKAQKNLQYTLPKVLSYIGSQQWDAVCL